MACVVNIIDDLAILSSWPLVDLLTGKQCLGRKDMLFLTKWLCILEFLLLEFFVADKAHASTCEWFIWTSVWIYDCPSFSAICGLGQDCGNSPVLVSNGVTEVLHWVCNLFSLAEPHTVRWEILQWRCCASRQIIPQVCLHYTYTHCQPWPTDTQQEWGWWTVYVQRDWLDPWHAAQGHQRRQYECSVGFFHRQQAYQTSSHEVCYSILNGFATLSLPYRQLNILDKLDLTVPCLPMPWHPSH